MGSFFGNPLMLLALLTISLPWIIEWLFRRRKRQIDLPTIKFLLKTKEQENIKRQDRILLILRTVGLFLLVLSLARPQIQRGLVGGAKKRNIIMLLDGTASMNQQAGVTTSFGLAQKKASALIRGIDTEAGVTAALLGARVQQIMEDQADLHTAAAEIDTLRAGLGAGTIRDGLAWIRDYLTRNNKKQTEIYIFSDFQKFTWTPPGGGTAEAVQILREICARNEVYLVDVGSQPRFNYMATELRPSDWVMSTGLPVSFKVQIETWGKPPEDAKPTVTFLVDGVKKDVREFLPGPQPTVINFDHKFATPGEYLVEVVVEGDQHLIDNRRAYLCTVPDFFKVLILDESAPMVMAGIGKGQSEAAPKNPLEQESCYLARAIEPPSHPGMEKVTRFTPKVIHPSMITYENLDSYPVVVMTQDSSLNETLAARLDQYVGAGGSLWIFLGPNINVYDYNKLLFKDGKGLLPAKIGAKTAGGAAEGAKGKPGHPTPKYGASTHPGLGGLGGSVGADAQFLAAYTLEPTESARVVLALTDESPALIEQNFGRGKVMLANTTAGVNWTYLPATMEYPILVQDMLRYLVGNPDFRVNLDAGDKFEQLVFVSAQHLLLRQPDGRKIRLTPKEREGVKDAYFVEFDETVQQGLYEIVGAAEGVLPRTRFVVNQKSVESDLSHVDESEFKSTYGRGSYAWVRPDIPIEDLAAKLHSVTEFAAYILWLLLICLGVESYLAFRFGKRRAKMSSGPTAALRATPRTP